MGLAAQLFGCKWNAAQLICCANNAANMLLQIIFAAQINGLRPFSFACKYLETAAAQHLIILLSLAAVLLLQFYISCAASIWNGCAAFSATHLSLQHFLAQHFYCSRCYCSTSFCAAFYVQHLLSAALPLLRSILLKRLRSFHLITQLFSAAVLDAQILQCSILLFATAAQNLYIKLSLCAPNNMHRYSCAEVLKQHTSITLRISLHQI